MAITSTGLDAAYYTDTVATTAVEDNTALDNDDFMTLLLAQLQYQDPTEPMDSETILNQTSQLAALESSENTNNALAALADSLGNSQALSSIAAIGKTADLGSNAISYDEEKTSSFEVYFPNNIQNGSVEILDAEGNIINTIPVEANSAGVYEFEWDGSLTSGEAATSGLYYVTASYSNTEGEAKTTRLGAYPIESIKFEDGEPYAKVGSSYISFNDISEIY